MNDTLLMLVLAHLLGDFVFWPATRMWAKRPASARMLLWHALMVTGTCIVVIGGLPWAVLAITFVTRLGIDWLTDRKPGAGPRVLVADQLLHLAVIFLLAWLYGREVGSHSWIGRASGQHEDALRTMMLFLGGYVLCVPAGGVMIGAFVSPLTAQIDRGLLEGLEHGGKYIGWLERSIVFLLMVIGQPAGIGFLIAAKSIFRFGEIKEPEHRKLAEYIIIGTFFSFGWALAATALMLHLLAEWV
jgi:hypothetical protein